MAAITPTALSTEAMKGSHVTDPRGEDLGKIKEVMIDLAAGRVAYAVMSFGGFLGIGARMVAIPWEALHASRRPDEYVADLSKDLLKEAPSFGKEKWPGGADRSFLSALYAYYGCTPYWDKTEEEEIVQQPVLTETLETVTETTTTEYRGLGEIGGIGREDLSPGMGERQHTSRSNFTSGMSDTDMTEERWGGAGGSEVPREESNANAAESDRIGEAGGNAQSFEESSGERGEAFGTTAGDSDRYADTMGADDTMEPGYSATDRIPEGQGDTRAFEVEEELSAISGFSSPQDVTNMSGASGISSANMTGGSEGISAAEDLTIGSVDDLNTLGSTLGLEDEVVTDDQIMELPGEGSRRGSSSSGDLRTNEEDISEEDSGTTRSGRGHSTGQMPSMRQDPIPPHPEEEENNP